ncbi:MAG: hypothetical protein U5K55_06240 [Aliarcobacter sp.]|nr:hypothetical protein [Aliarcobacter sp.]
MAEKINQPVFYAMPKITEKFNVEHTPSIITQIGNKMELKKYAHFVKRRNKIEKNILYIYIYYEH